MARPPSELLQQPIDIVQFLPRPFLLRAAAAEFFLDRLGALPLTFLRHRHVGVVGRRALVVAPKRIAPTRIGTVWLAGQRTRAAAVATLVVRHHHAHGALGSVFAVLALFSLAGLRTLLLRHRLGHLA